MRVMVIVKATPESEANSMTTEQMTKMFEEMGAYNEELLKAGIMLMGDGLTASSNGKRVHFSGKDRTVVDGPFSETKELIAGFWIWQVKSMDEAVEWARRIPNPDHADGEIELRPVFTDEDFGAALTPDIRDQAQRLRAQTEGGNAHS